MPGDCVAAQPAVPLPGLIEDVRVDLLPQPAAGDPEQLGDLAARERGLLGAQEELSRLAVEDRVAERVGGQPALVALDGLHGLAKVLAAEFGIGVIEQRELELGHGRDGGITSPSHAMARGTSPGSMLWPASDSRSTK